MNRFDPLTVDLACVNLIEASAGTGKTHSIATLFVRLLLEKQLRVDQILVVTFTRAATAELRERLRARLRLTRDELLVQGGHERDLRLLDDALRSFDTAAIHTIHGFCQRVLQENAFESGARFDATLQEDDALLRALVHEHWAQRLYRSDPFFARYLREQGTDLAALLELGKRASTHRDALILPAARTQDLARPIAAWRTARDVAAAIWKQQRQAIVELLCQPGVLNAGSHNPDRIRTQWLPWLDDALASDRMTGLIGGDSGSFLQRCTPDWLTKKTNKKFTGSTPQHAFFDAAAALVEQTVELQSALEAGRLALLRDLADRVRSELPGRKDDQGRWSFDDLIYQLREALRRPGSALADRIRERFKVALIDEFQDTDPVQYEIFSTVWAGHDGLFLIGDPKQAIYSFRGADVYAYLKAVQQAEARATLPTNHRSDQGLVSAVNALFGRGKRPFVFDEIPFEEVGAKHGCRVHGSKAAPFELLVVQSKELITKGRAWYGVAQSVAADLVALLDSEVKFEDADTHQLTPLQPGQLAVLCRTNRQAQHMQHALREAGLPSVLQSGASVFDSAEAFELERLLAAVADPGDLRAVRSALATRILGVTSSQLLAVVEDPAAWTTQVNRLQELGEVWQRRGVLACLRGVLEDGLMQRWLAEVNGERRLTNLLHLAELAQQAAADRHLGPQALVQWLHRLRVDEASRSEEVGDTAQLRLESDDDAVQLVTIHRSKGLQYDVVYAPFLWDGALLRKNERWWQYHEQSDEHPLVINLEQSGVGKAAAEVEALAESLRVLYVALTRARLLCRCVWGSFNDAGTSPLAYLLHGGGAAADAAEWIAGGKQRTNALVDELRAPLDALAKASQGAIGVRDFELGQRAQLRRQQKHAPTKLAAAELTRDPPHGYSLSSYSSLIAQRERQPRLEEEADRDRASVPVPADPSASGATIALARAGAGARFGRVVHALLEQSELSTVTADALRSTLAQLPGADELLDAPARGGVARALAAMLERPLGAVAPGFSLRQVTRQNSLVELPFQLAVAPAVFTSPRTTANISTAALAELFEKRAVNETARRYAEQLRLAAISPPPGFLSGYIDLLLVHQGRWYVVDYKTNFLGSLVADYAPTRLAQAMLHHHYVLQYHLYAAAVDRYLRWRRQNGQPDLADYDYAQNFGGVLYLFVRGMCEGAPAESGIFFDCPPAALIHGLQVVLDGGRP